MFQTVLLTRFVRIGVLLMAFCLAPSAMSATAAPATAPAVVMLGGEIPRLLNVTPGSLPFASE